MEPVNKLTEKQQKYAYDANGLEAIQERSIENNSENSSSGRDAKQVGVAAENNLGAFRSPDQMRLAEETGTSIVSKLGSEVK